MARRSSSHQSPQFAAGIPRRLSAVVTAFTLVAGVGAVAVVSQSLAAGDRSLPRHALGENLINNSGFGEGLRSWTRTKAGARLIDITKPGVGGSEHAARIQAPRTVRADGSRTESRRTGYLSDDRRTAPRARADAVYQASAWVRATGGPVSGALRLVEWRGGSVANVTVEPFRARHSKWSSVTLVAPATTTGGRLQIGVVARELSSTRGIKIDRVRLHPVTGANATSVPTTPLPDDTSPDGDGDSTSSPTPSTTSSPSTTPSPSPTPTSTPLGKTLFGASVYEGGRTWTGAVADSNEAYGGMEVVRVFYPGLPSAWPGRAGQVGGPVVVSFKANPTDIVAGKHDEFFAKWFSEAPRNRDIWWTYWHEPEDDVESGNFRAEEWRDAYRRLAGLANAADNPKLHNTVILMCWTVNPRSGRDFDDFFPGKSAVEALGWDCYSHPSDATTYARPEDMYGRAVTKSRELGLPWGIAETGSRLVPGDESGEKRAVWLRSIGSWLAQRDAAFVTYFDSVVGGEFRLLDQPSKSAWRDVVNNF